MQYTFKRTACDVCGSWESEELIAFPNSAYHRCVQCGLIFSQPMVENYGEILEQACTERLDKYTSKVSTHRKRNIKRIRCLRPYRQNGNFLEVGCSAGALLDVARRAGWNVKGVDPSSSATAYAREHLGLDVFTGTVEQAAYPDNYFDVIFTNATMEHLRHPLSTMKECCRILRPGGVFYADTVNWDSFTRRFFGARWKLLNPIGHIHLYTPANVAMLCRQAGMEMVKVWTTGVRTRPGLSKSEGFGWLDLCKGPLSLLARMTHKGDSIKFIARKPGA